MGWTVPCYCLAQCSIDMAKMMLRGYNLLVLNVGFFEAKCGFLNLTDVEYGERGKIVRLVFLCLLTGLWAIFY